MNGDTWLKMFQETDLIRYRSQTHYNTYTLHMQQCYYGDDFTWLDASPWST